MYCVLTAEKRAVSSVELLSEMQECTEKCEYFQTKWAILRSVVRALRMVHAMQISLVANKAGPTRTAFLSPLDALVLGRNFICPNEYLETIWLAVGEPTCERCVASPGYPNPIMLFNYRGGGSLYELDLSSTKN